MKTIFDMVRDYKGKIIRYWEYKKPGVEYKYDYEDYNGPFISAHCDYAQILDAYALPDGDVMLVLGDNDDSYREFLKLSEIEIAFSPKDQEDE